MKKERPRREKKQALKVDDLNADKLTELIKVLALHINSGVDVPEPEKCPGIIAHATGMLFSRSKKPELKPEDPKKKEEEKKSDPKEEDKEDPKKAEEVPPVDP